MNGTETTIVRMDGDNRPVSVSMVTGVVDRPNSYYATPLKGDDSRRLFLDLVGVVRGAEMPAFIKACNRAASRKRLATEEDRRDAVLQYAGITPTQAKPAAQHSRSCDCPRCLVAHVEAGCRVTGCKVCFA